MDMQRGNDQPMARPGQSAQPVQPKFERANNFGSTPAKQSKDSMMMWHKKKLICIVIVIIAVILLCFVCMWGRRMWFSNEGSINGGEYQAVFLTNGQVYFGKLSNVDDGYAKLTNIYYLQVQQQVQPTTGSSNSQTPQVSLTKLGNELHGPEDQMYIAHDQMLFWENLKGNGKVAQAIAQYLKNNSK
ncbi:MAG TPA: hypothetical protein VNG90_03125 [Candidatus Acidoferrum sp.]|nr:hypothetical protein [Candidatus Acidoferrum sp.]